jgi:hypothetical protein
MGEVQHAVTHLEAKTASAGLIRGVKDGAAKLHRKTVVL